MKEANTYFLLVLLIVPMLIVSCTDRQKVDKSSIIARINGDVLTEDMLLEFAGISSLEEISDSEKREKIDEWIKISLLAQEADNRGLTESSRIESRIRLAEQSIKANLLLAELFHAISPTETELFNYYQIHKGRYSQERNEYRIQRIFFNNEAIADSVSRAIIDEEILFGIAARTFSEEAARENDGYIGYLTIDEMDEPTRRAIGNLSRWRYMKVSGNGGFYLIRYTDMRVREAARTFTEVIDQVKEEYVSEKKRDYIDKAIEELMQQSEIVISR